MKAWRATEETAAAKLGGRRHPRRYGVSSPDVTLDLGDARLVVEAKTRSKVPGVVRQALDQAAGYCLAGFGQVPVGVIRATKSKVAVVVCYLDDFVSLLRLEAARSPGAGPSPSPSSDRPASPAVAQAGGAQP